MTEQELLRQMREDPYLRGRCRALGEFAILVATARTSLLLNHGDAEELSQLFSAPIMMLATNDVADAIVDLVRVSGLNPPGPEF